MKAAPTVIVHSGDPGPALAILRADHPDLTILGCDSYAALPQVVEDSRAEAVYSIRFEAGTPFPRDALMASSSVKWISVGGSGVDHLGRWDTSRVTVTNAAGVAAGMMAEYVLGTLLQFSLGLAGFRKAQADRRWLSGGKVTPIEGQTALILGLGKTGQAVARRLEVMGMEVLGVRARPQPTTHFDEVHGLAALPDLWPRADVVICCVPLLDSTRGLVNAAAFGAMKPGALLIDVSRGGVVDDAALIAALRDGTLTGAALDVFATEPLPQDSPLWGMETVILTPHCSSVYDGWDLKSVRMFSENLSRYRSGEPLDNIVDPVRGY